MSQSARKCLKCQHINPQASMTTEEACPKCGGIYSRVEAYLNAASDRAGPPSRLPKSPTPARQPTRRPDNNRDFVAHMRSQSLYPNFRMLTKIFVWCTYLLALGIGITGLSAGGMATTAAIFGAIFLVIAATVAKEAALMMADLSDATVLNAATNSARDAAASE